MITNLSFVSPYGEKMPLFGNQYFTLTDIDRFTGVESTLASVVIPFMDGDIITNVQAQPREVTLTLRTSQAEGTENCKSYILRYVRIKQACKLYMMRDGKELELEGVVTAIDLQRFTEGCTMMITMHCSQPYWADVDWVVSEIKSVIPLHHFPIAFYTALPFGVYDDDTTQECINEGDISTGMRIHIIALDTVTNPKIIDANTAEYIGVNDSLVAGDEIIINTFKGQKSITKNGVNILNKIMSGSTFLQLSTGVNEYTIQATAGVDSVYFRLEYKGLYI